MQDWNIYCYLKTGPVLFVIIVNMLLLFVSLKNAFKLKRRISKISIIRQNAIRSKRRALVLIVLLFFLGITWISFILYIHERFAFFSYLFILLNGLQVFKFFIFNIIKLTNKLIMIFIQGFVIFLYQFILNFRRKDASIKLNQK